MVLEERLDSLLKHHDDVTDYVNRLKKNVINLNEA